MRIGNSFVLTEGKTRKDAYLNTQAFRVKVQQKKDGAEISAEKV
jgi:hypothetical protein